MSIHRGARVILLALALAVAVVCVPAEADVQGGNNPIATVAIPTLDGFGLAALAGSLALAGSWLAARQRRKK